jgi:hypothetical protein
MHFQQIPERFRTPELCLALAHEHPDLLYHVPVTMFTAERCLELVTANGNVLEYIPTHLQTLELCRVAIEQNGYALRFVPAHLRTLELCSVAVENNGDALEFVPKNIITQKLCEIAIDDDADVYRNIPKHLNTIELATKAIRTHHDYYFGESELSRKVMLYLADTDSDGNLDFDRVSKSNASMAAKAPVSNIYLGVSTQDDDDGGCYAIVSQCTVELLVNTALSDNSAMNVRRQRNWIRRLLTPSTALPLYVDDEQILASHINLDIKEFSGHIVCNDSSNLLEFGPALPSGFGSAPPSGFGSAPPSGFGPASPPDPASFVWL